MVVIKCTAKLPPQNFEVLCQDLHAQAHSDGLVLLPYFCDLVAATEDSELQVVKEENGTRVAELEKELAAALADLSAAPSCETCKHGEVGTPAYGCMGAEGNCHHCITKACPCRGCENGSGWEWRHGHAND